MERKIYLVIIFLLFFVDIFAQKNANETIYKAFISGDMTNWKQEIDKMEQAEFKNYQLILDLINYQTGYIGWCIGQENDYEAEKYLQKAQLNLNTLKQKNYKMSYVHAYQGAIDGLQIGLNVYKAPFIGPGIIDKAELAIELDPKNPYGYILLANSNYYMWAVLGGSKERALEDYLKSEKLMKNQSLDKNNWNYLSLLTIIAHALEDMDNPAEAKNYYEKILRIEPDYEWVKSELYPKFLITYQDEK